MNDHVNRISALQGMLILVLLTTGCSGPDSWKVRTHKTSGNITINGAHPVNAMIILKSIGDPIDTRHSQPWGEVGQDGTYQLTTYQTNDGAPAGTYAITLFWPSSPGSDIDRLKEQFDSIENAVAQVEIKSGNNTIPDIKLEGVKLSEPTSKREPHDQQEIR